ncbi:MAG: hypothetical protein E6R08_10125 [Nevskiaceae bacterium]|nr:MAG: hypothetical protein E6R08_10125 [Nevskiaceae bacterium]
MNNRSGRKRAAIRNPLHAHPLLSKGCAHGKAQKAKRQAGRVKLRRGEWDCQSDRASAIPVTAAQGAGGGRLRSNICW